MEDFTDKHNYTITENNGFAEAPPAPTRQHPSYGDCVEVKREYYQNCSVLD